MEQSPRTSPTRGLGRHVKTSFTTGLLVLVPVVLTYVVLRFVFDLIDGVLQPEIESLLGRRVPGLGLLALAVVVYVVGLVGNQVLGRKLIGLGQRFLLRLPLVNTVYASARELIESFAGQGPTGFKRVVAFESPRPGVWTIGFLTGLTQDEQGRWQGIIYVPTAPTPNSGWMNILPTEDVYDTDLDVPTAMRLVLSGGIVAPAAIRKRPIDVAALTSRLDAPPGTAMPPGGRQTR